MKGMQVIKAFHLVGDRQKRTNLCYRELSDALFDYEKKFVVPAVLADSMIAISIGVMVSLPPSHCYREQWRLQQCLC